MEFVKNKIRTSQTKKTVVDRFYMDDDRNVPDAKEDIGKIIVGKGTIATEELLVIENHVRVTGKLYYSVLYVTEGMNPHLSSLDGELPFEELIYMEGEKEEPYELLNSQVECSVSLIHSRKFALRAMVELEIGNGKTEEIALPVDVEEDGIYEKKKELQILTLRTMKKDTYRIKEEITLPGTKENIGQLLWTDVESRKLDTKLGKNMLKLSGELMFFCLYESLDGKMDWFEKIVPYQGEVQCNEIEETMFHEAFTSLEDIHVDPRMDEDGEMRSVGIEGILQLRISVYEEKNMEILTDIYSLEQECHVEKKEEYFEELLIQNHSKYKQTEQISLPELQDDILQICCNSGRVQMEQTKITEHGILIEGMLQLRFLYVKENDAMPFDVWQGRIPFSYHLECGKITKDVMCEIQPVLEQLSVSLLGGGNVEVKAVLGFHSLIRQRIQEEIMVNFSLKEREKNENEQTPGIIGYYVKEGEELWDLAKKYRTTIARIKEVNQLENDEVKEGDRILIFKGNMGIL